MLYGCLGTRFLLKRQQIPVHLHKPAFISQRKPRKPFLIICTLCYCSAIVTKMVLVNFHHFPANIITHTIG